MSLTLTDVKRIAHLAHIEVGDTEAESYLRQLSNIFQLVREMQAVDTTGIEPMDHALHAALRVREDTVTETDLHVEFQRVAPQTEAGLYLVPQVIE